MVCGRRVRVEPARPYEARRRGPPPQRWGGGGAPAYRPARRWENSLCLLTTERASVNMFNFDI